LTEDANIIALNARKLARKIFWHEDIDDSVWVKNLLILGLSALFYLMVFIDQITSEEDSCMFAYNSQIVYLP